MALAITLAGFAGGLIMSAIQRDRGVKDYGTLIQGNDGRWWSSWPAVWNATAGIESVCFHT